MPATRLTGTFIRSGSIPTTALGGGVVSSSTQVTISLPTGTVSSSTQFKTSTDPFTGSFTGSFKGDGSGLTGVTSAGTVSSSTQIDITQTVGYTTFSSSLATVDAGQTTRIDNLSSATSSYAINATIQSQLAGVVSSSTQVKPLLPDGTVTSSVQYPGWVTASSQIDYNNIQNKLSGVVSSSTQVQPLLPGGTVSSSGQIDYNSITNKLSGVVSASAQILPLLPTGTISSSGQVIVQNTTGIGALATTGSNTFTANQTITGSLFISQNLVVQGSSSISYISQSTLNIGTNVITVNTNTPGTRFGGLSVIDSGSSPLRSGSLYFDSINDQWIFVHQNTAGGVTSSVLLVGPQTFNNIGNETLLTQNRVLKSNGLEHVTDSQITDNGITVSITNGLSAGTTITASSFTATTTSSLAAVYSSSGQVVTAVTGQTITPATISSSGNIAAGTNLISNNSIGDEGGEILLAKPQTNTGIAGTGVTIDIFQNKLRFYEQGGSARGFFVDVTSGSGAAGTNLQAAASAVSTYTNATDNRVITSTGAGGINAESTLTYDGTVLAISTNGAKYFQGGDDAALYDVNVANTLGIHGQQDSTVGAIKLGSSGQTIYSNATGVGIGTTTPGTLLHVQGTVSASSFTSTGAISGSGNYRLVVPVGTNLYAT